MTFDQIRAPDHVNWSSDQVGRTSLRTYENQLHPIDKILVQKERKFCAYKKVIWDRSGILSGFRVLGH